MIYDVATYFQYDKANNLKTLLNKIAENASIDFDEWFRKYFYLRYCNHDGLTWWGQYLNQEQYILVPDPQYKIILNKLNQAYFNLHHSPITFNHGNLYNGKMILVEFTNEEFRLILMNAWLKTYYACTIGNLYMFLSDFFKKLPDMKYKDTKWYITTIARENAPDFWWIEYYPAFAPEDEKWAELFRSRRAGGDSVIMPIPNDVQWDVRLKEVTEK